MHYFITGATGFIGKFLTERLLGRGGHVHVLVRPEHIQPDPPPGSLNRLAGRTGAQRYLGALTRYDFEVPGAAKPFLAESPIPAAQAIAIAPEHIRLLDH